MIGSTFAAWRSSNTRIRQDSCAAGHEHSSATVTLSLLKNFNAGVSGCIAYQSREDESTQSPTQTLDRGLDHGRDFAVLFVEAARSLGCGARIASGYFYRPDQDIVGLGAPARRSLWPAQAGSPSIRPTAVSAASISSPLPLQPTHGGNGRGWVCRDDRT